MTDNPYVITQLTADGPSYRREIHMVAITNIDAPPDVLTPDALWILSPNYPGAGAINDALHMIGDWSLIAEVWRNHGYVKCIAQLGEQQAQLERKTFQVGLE